MDPKQTRTEIDVQALAETALRIYAQRSAKRAEIQKAYDSGDRELVYSLCRDYLRLEDSGPSVGMRRLRAVAIISAPNTHGDETDQNTSKAVLEYICQAHNLELVGDRADEEGLGCDFFRTSPGLEVLHLVRRKAIDALVIPQGRKFLKPKRYTDLALLDEIAGAGLLIYSIDGLVDLKRFLLEEHDEQEKG